jgi:hypothetical protein
MLSSVLKKAHRACFDGDEVAVAITIDLEIGGFVPINCESAR